MKNSFALRLTFRVAALVTLTALVVLALGGWMLRFQGIRSIDIMQDIEGRELSRLLAGPPEPTPAQIVHHIANNTDSDIALYRIQVVNARGEILYRSSNLGPARIPAEHDAPRRRALAKQRDGGLIHDPAHSAKPDIYRWNIELDPIGTLRVSEYEAGPLRIQIASPLAGIQRIVRNYAYVATALVTLTALLSLGVGHLFSRTTLAPLRAIERTARRIRADNLGERIPVPPGRDEFASLATLLNNTFDHLETAFAQVRRFTADASHELKTPLALIRLTAEKLRPHLAPTPGADAMLADLLEETHHMHRILESLLFLAKAESGALTLARTPHAMDAFINDFAEDARALTEDRHLHFHILQNTPGHAPIEPHSLRQLLRNLLNNAIAATPPGGHITLESTREGPTWRLILSDEGPGVPPEMLERIFERFVRHTPAAHTPGDGLGLAICRSIAELHNGKIHAENHPHHPGLRVTLQWAME